LVRGNGQIQQQKWHDNHVNHECSDDVAPFTLPQPAKESDLKVTMCFLDGAIERHFAAVEAIQKLDFVML